MEENQHRSVFSYIRGFLIHIGLPVLILGVVWFFFGKIKVTASLDGRPLDGAIVKIKGVERCRTPCEIRLTRTSYNMLVTPPDSVETAETYATLRVWATGALSVGGTFNVPFHSPSDTDDEEP